tara:strand:+ start:1380 stop:2357 length:978 start_codon:yes stop_codon:yes gene_type:complete
MALAGRATDLALDFISQPDALGATAEEVKTLQHDDLMDDAEDVDDDASLDLAPKAQIITTACWLTVKETSLLTGEIIASSTDVFSFDAIKSTGERLMKVLFAVKHTGALEKTRIGMTAVCSRLMRSDDAAMKALPQRWLEDLLDQLNRPGQGIRDRVRRSAGLPYAFMSILLAEPKGQPRLALDGALPRLLDIASGVVSSDIPRVHAFNVIRVIFADRDLTMDTTPYAARGVQVCIDAFSSPTWEVRPLLSRAFVLAFSPRHAGGIVACALALRLGAWLVPQQHSRSSNKERPRAPAGVWKLELNIRLSMFADQTLRLTFASTML